MFLSISHHFATSILRKNTIFNEHPVVEDHYCLCRIIAFVQNNPFNFGRGKKAKMTIKRNKKSLNKHLLCTSRVPKNFELKKEKGLRKIISSRHSHNELNRIYTHAHIVYVFYHSLLSLYSHYILQLLEITIPFLFFPLHISRVAGTGGDYYET